MSYKGFFDSFLSLLEDKACGIRSQNGDIPSVISTESEYSTESGYSTESESGYFNRIFSSFDEIFGVDVLKKEPVIITDNNSDLGFLSDSEKFFAGGVDTSNEVSQGPVQNPLSITYPLIKQTRINSQELSTATTASTALIAEYTDYRGKIKSVSDKQDVISNDSNKSPYVRLLGNSRQGNSSVSEILKFEKVGKRDSSSYLEQLKNISYKHSTGIGIG